VTAFLTIAGLGQLITLPAKRSRIPGVPKWEAVEQFLARCSRRRDKAMLALMVYGGLRRAEVVRLNIGDYQPRPGPLWTLPA
jgi:integrase